jgi:oligopeptide/dipeptide ABC transporter ATP-binding protein
MNPSPPLLSLKNLTVEFDSLKGPLHALRSVSLDVHAGETLGIVGESGCGKSVTSLAIMRLLPANGKITHGSVSLQNTNLLEISESKMRNIRGAKIGMIFQDPMTSLNPAYSVEFQLSEAIRTHSNQKLNDQEIHKKCISLLQQVGISAPEERLSAYPFQLSGGMSQRVMIAMTLAGEPDILIADEPTTALDVTIQSQILALIKSIQVERKMGVILITHDLAVVSEVADRIAVMYAGEVVELGSTDQVLQSPRHPYTRALLNSIPRRRSTSRPDASLGAIEMVHSSEALTLPQDIYKTASTGSPLKKQKARLPTISGLVPDLASRPKGCQFNPRCEKVFEPCLERSSELLLSEPGHAARCHLYANPHHAPNDSRGVSS